MDNLKFGWWRQGVGAGVAVFYLATNVVFCHSAEARFWSARREAARKLNKNGGAVASASRSAAPTDALVLAQLPGGVRFDVHSPAPAYVTPVPAKENLVGGKVPVFSSDLPRWLGDVVTPFGNIRDVHLSKRPGAPLVIHIQDLHDSTEAQRNIAGLVEALQDERGVSLVGLEGAQGAFATEAFRAFPDAEITKAVSTYFMEEGYLGGPEFAGITAKRVPLLWGVEDMAGYNANVTAVKESAQNRPAMELFLREARTLLNEIKTRRLSPALLEFDRNFSAYQSRKLSLGAYVRYLLKSSPSGATRAPNLVLLRDALTWEDSLDFPRIERERASLLERMVQVLPKHQLKNLVDKSALYRLGRISYGDYYRFFRTLCEENGISLTEYRQLHAYVRYVLLAERINRNDLLNELSALELSVQDQLVSHPGERRVVKAARHLGQLERLVRHSYTPMDWGYHILHEDEIRNVGLTVRALAKEEGLPETLSPPTVEELKPFENFCLQALGRNGAMVSNLLEKMAAEKRPSAVLVAGGFHTDGMTQLFRQKDVSYVVVTPKINGELPDGHRTLDILARDPAPLEKLFAGETVNIPTPGMTNIGNAVSHPLARKFAALFVVITLGLTVATNQSFASTPNNLPSPLSATASPVPGTSDARVTMGEKVYRVQLGSEDTPSFLEDYTAPIPGFGTVRVRGETPFSFALQFTELKGRVTRGFENQWIAVSNGSKISWEWILGLMGIGSVRRVGEGLTTYGVTPPQPVSRTGDTTSAPGGFTLSTLSPEGQILLALERLAGFLPPAGTTKKELLNNVLNGFYLRELADGVRTGLLGEFDKWNIGDEVVVTPEFIKDWVANNRRLNSQFGPSILQKPGTFRLLELWKSEKGIKGLLARHDVWGTALLEELGVPGKWKGLFEGRLPAALAGALLGTLAVIFLMSWAQMALLAFGMAGLWNVMGPQKKFVADHGKDQTRAEIIVRSFGTFILNLVAISISAVMIYVAPDPGISGALAVLSVLSPVMGLMAAVGVHAFFDLLDVFPGARSSFVDFQTDAPTKNIDVKTDPLSIENPKPNRFDLAGKTLQQLDQIVRMAADHDLGGSANDYLNKHANGVLGTPSANDVVATSTNFSPYWWQRYWIRNGIEKIGGYVEKGEGGDDYKISLDLTELGDPDVIQAKLQGAVDYEHDRMRDQFAFYSIYQGNNPLDGEQEIRVAAEFNAELAKDGRMVIVRQGTGLTLAVRRESPQDNLGSIENRLRGLSSHGLSYRRVDDTRLGLGLFAYSMGGQSVGDVVRRLQLQTSTGDDIWFDANGGLRADRVNDVEEWSDRLAEDMLGVAKANGRRQAFFAPDLETMMVHERKGTVATYSPTVEGQPEQQEPDLHEAFKTKSNHDFWNEVKEAENQEQDKHVVVFEVAQYRRQPVTIFGISLFEVVLQYLPVRVGRFIPARWVQGLEKRIQSRAFHSWQGTDQKGKGNFGIEQHFNYAMGVLGIQSEPEPLVVGRSVDTFSFFLRGPPHFEANVLNSNAQRMKKALKEKFPEEKKVDPYHIVYDINVTKWLEFLDKLNRERDNESVPSDRPGQQVIQKHPHLTIDDVVAMQNAVVTFMGRRHGPSSLANELGGVFDVMQGRDHMLLSMEPTQERLAELERIYRQAQAANARAAELVLRARAPAQLGSVLFNRLVKGVEILFDVSPTRAKQIVAGRWVQSVIVPVLELPVMPFVALGAAWGLSIVGFGWGGVVVGSVVMAWIHGKPKSIRGPPEWADLEERGAQTYGQFFVRFGVALIINSISLLAGGVPLESLFQAQPIDLSSIDFTRLISSAYSLHSVYNFFAPEQYRLSLLEQSAEADAEKRLPKKEIHLLTPLDFVDNMFLVSRRYNNLREAYQRHNALTPEELTKKIERISRFNFRIPVNNTHQPSDYIDMVVGLCTLDENTPNPAPDSDLLRLILYERAVRLIEFAEKVKNGGELTESEKRERDWVVVIFSPLAATVPEESNDFVFGMDISAVLTDLRYFIESPTKYLAKRNELIEFYNGRNPSQEGEDWLVNTREKIESAVQRNVNFGEAYELRIKTVASTMVKGLDKPHYADVKKIKDLITGTIVVPIKENKTRIDWDRGVLARISRIVESLKSDDPNAAVVLLSAEELKKGEKNPDKKAEGYYHVNLIFKGMAFELQFKTPEMYVTQKVGSRASGEGTMAHYVHKSVAFLRHLKEFFFPNNMELRAHRTPFVGDFNSDFKAFWNRARRYTIVIPLDENDLKDPNKAVDVMRLPRGATTADFMAHSWVDPEFTMTEYSPAYLVDLDGNVNAEALPLTAPLAMGAQITVRGPPQTISGPRLRLEIVDTSKTFRLWAKGIEGRDAGEYEPAGKAFIEFMGLAKENRAGRPAVDDDLNQFLLKHDIDFETLVLLIGEEIVTKRPFGEVAQQGVIGRLVRHFADKGLRENKILIEQQGSLDYQALLNAADSTLKDHVLDLSKYLDGIDGYSTMEPEERAYLIGLGLWNMGGSKNPQGNQSPINGLVALALLDPTGVGWVSLLGIGVVLAAFYPPFKGLILGGLKKVRPYFGLRHVLGGLFLVLVTGVGVAVEVNNLMFFAGMVGGLGVSNKKWRYKQFFENLRTNEITAALVNNDRGRDELTERTVEVVDGIVEEMENSVVGSFVPNVNDLRKIRDAVKKWNYSATKVFFIERLERAIDLAEIVNLIDQLDSEKKKSRTDKKAIEKIESDVRALYSAKLKNFKKTPEDIWGLVLLDRVQRISNPVELGNYLRIGKLLFRYSLRDEVPYNYTGRKTNRTYVSELRRALEARFKGEWNQVNFNSDDWETSLINIKQESTKFIQRTSGGLWFKGDRYKPYGFFVETPGLFGLLTVVQGVLVYFGVSLDPWVLVALYPLLFWTPHYMFNRELFKSMDVIELTINKLVIGFLVWGPGASLLTIGFGLLMLGYTTVRHFEMNGGTWFRPKKEILYNGVGNGLDRAVIGRVLPVEPEPFSGVIYPVYKIAGNKDSDEVKSRAVGDQVRRIDEAMISVSGDREIAHQIPDQMELGVLSEKFKNRIRGRLFNAQAMVVEELDLAIVGQSVEGEKQKLRKLKQVLIEILGKKHSLDHTHDQQSVITDQIRKMREAALPIWREITNDDSISEFPDEYNGDGSENGDRLVALHMVINDCLVDENGTGISGVKNGRAAVVVLKGLWEYYVKNSETLRTKIEEASTENKSDLEKFKNTQEDISSTILRMITYLNPHINDGEPDVEIIRFNAAATAARGISTNPNQKIFLTLLQVKVPRLVKEGRKARSAIKLVAIEFVKNNSRVDRDLIKQSAKAILAALADPQLSLFPDLEGQDVVVVSKDPLKPNQIIDIRRNWGLNVKAYVMFIGTQAMHGPISIKAAGFPCVGLNNPDGWEAFRGQVKRGESVAVFSREGRIVFWPSNKTRKEVKRVNERADRLNRIFAKNREPNGIVTLRGSPDSEEGIAEAKKRGAQGTGLYRTEVIFYSSAGEGVVPPLGGGETLNIQFEDYMVDDLVTAAKKNGEAPFRVRIFDFDPNLRDKPSKLPFPTGGERGAQYILSEVGRPFAQQEIHAVMRAYLQSPNIQLFFPMVSNADEAVRLRQMVEDVRENRVTGLTPFSEEEKGKLLALKVGIMAETEEAVKNISALVPLVDFISIGTKDLTLSVHGLTSENPQADLLLERLDRKVIDSIIAILKAAKGRDEGAIPVSACGVLAGNEIFIPVAILLAREYQMELSLPPTEVDKWNTLIKVINGMNDELSEFKEMLNDIGNENSDAMTQKAQEIIDRAMDQIDRSEKWNPGKWLSSSNSAKWVILGGLGVVLLLTALFVFADVQTVVGGVTNLLEAPGLEGGKSLGKLLSDGGAQGAFGLSAASFLIAGIRGMEENTYNNGGNNRNGKFPKIMVKDSRGAIDVSELELSESDVYFVNEGPNSRVYLDGENLKCDINNNAIDRWNKNDSNALGRDTNIKKFTAYTRTQLHTAVLAAMARYIMVKSGATDVEQAIENVGLTEEAVRRLFTDDGANGEAIRELQNNRFVTLLFTSWAVHFSDVLPIGKPGQLELGILGMNSDLPVEESRNRLAALAEFDLGAREADLNSGNDLWSLAKKTAPTQTDEFRPNGLAVALDTYAANNGVTAIDMKNRLAVTMLSRMDVWKSTLTRDRLFELWSSLALLFGLNGHLSEGRAGHGHLGEALRKVRGHLQNLDLRFLVNLSHTTGIEMNNGTDLIEQGVEQFNRVAQEALSLRDPYQALTESFAKGEDILVYVSPNMVLKKSNDLTAAEKTQIDMLTLLSKRLVDTEDLEAAAWLEKKKRIVFAVVGTERQLSKLEISKSSLLSALIKAGADVAGLNRGADLGQISLGFATFMPANKSETVLAKSEFDKLEIDKVSLFALDVEGVTVDYSGVKDKIVSFILALAGGLMTQVAPGIVESLKKQQAVKRSA